MNEKVNQIRIANDIVDVISQYMPLSKKGKNYFGICPFHDDNNPSMSVSKDKQIYKCFSCGASGNVINFVMDYEKVDFKEAVSILAKKAGIEFNKGTVSTKEKKFDKYYDMYDLALKLYQNNINSAKGIAAINYLNDRGITKDLIKEFKIGLSLNKDTLTKVLQNKGYTNKEMEDYGLGNGLHDLYINRIMFPLFDTNDRPIGFSGRIYTNIEGSKYINTKETPIFKKGELLYNYYKAKEFARLDKKVLLVEGFMDVIRLHSIGIKNAVALMGTALTKQQITLLKRISNNICLCLDGDNAGRKASISVGKDLTQADCNVSVISLPNNYDPDEFIIKYGENKFRNFYENPLSYSEFKINYMKEGLDLNDIEGKSLYINEVLKEIKQEDDEVKQELMLKKLEKEFDINIDILKNNLKKLEKYSKIKALSTNEVPRKKKTNKYEKATLNILYSIMESYEACKYYEKHLNFLPSKEARYLANEIIYTYKLEGKLVLADFITKLNDKEELLDLTKEVLKVSANESNFEAFKDYIAVIKEYNKNQEIKRLKELIEKETDIAEKAKYLEKIRLVKMGSEN